MPFEPGRPSVIVARTVKGKGISAMEHDESWHRRVPDEEQLAAALADAARELLGKLHGGRA